MKLAPVQVCEHDWEVKTSGVVADNPNFNHKHEFFIKNNVCKKCGITQVIDYGRTDNERN